MSICQKATQAKIRRGTAFIVSGPSGVGKSTLLKELRQRRPDLRFSISCTTRNPRPGELHGEHYYFLSKEEYAQKVANGEFLEHAEVFQNGYGTLRSEIMGHVQNGFDVCLDIDVQGAMQLKDRTLTDEEWKNCAAFIFIVPPSRKELEQRLRGRQSDSEEQIQLRLAGAEKELSFWKKYDFVIVNDQLPQAVLRMEKLLDSLQLATGRYDEEYF